MARARRRRAALTGRPHQDRFHAAGPSRSGKRSGSAAIPLISIEILSGRGLQYGCFRPPTDAVPESKNSKASSLATLALATLVLTAFAPTADAVDVRDIRISTGTDGTR